MQKHFLTGIALIFGAISLSSYHDGVASKGLGNKIQPGGCSGNGCHNNSPTAPTLFSISLQKINNPNAPYETSYAPGETYRVLIAGSNQTGISQDSLGFQLSTTYLANSLQAGGFQNGSKTQVVNQAGLQLLEHKTALHRGSTLPLLNLPEFIWTAPATNGNGSIVLELIICQVNGDGTVNGDISDYTQKVFTEKVSNSTNSLPESQGVSLFPNPAFKSIQLLVDNPSPKDYLAHVVDITGRLLFAREVSGSTLKSGITIEINHFPKGSYFLHLSDGNSRKILPFSKQ